MTEKPPEYDYVDYTLIRFPSDRLTIGTMRRLHPNYFDVERAPFERALAITPDEDSVDVDEPQIGQILFIERMLALNAFEQVHQQFTTANFMGSKDKPGFVDDLVKFYVRYGIASGRKSALELIRDIETQAASQATGPAPERF
jgi:hypothetical protein